jgi:ubiquitin carboxyl-terminal hydrolase 9/24
VVKFSEFDSEVGMRAASGYVGLKNFGCTCYMNALIQQLYMIPDLRKGILEADITDPEFETNVLYQMKLIFANLQESEK